MERLARLLALHDASAPLERASTIPAEHLFQRLLARDLQGSSTSQP